VLDSSDLERLNLLADDLAERARRLPIRRLSSPSNLSVERSRVLDGLRQGVVVEPRLEYEQVPMDARSVLFDDRADHWNGDTPFDALVAEDVEDTVEYAEAMRSHAASLISDLTARLYGRPDASLVSAAEEVLAGGSPAGSGSDEGDAVQAQAAANLMAQTLERLGINGWSAEVSATMYARMVVQPSTRRVRVRANASFSCDEMRRLIVHEIGIHAARYENACRQPLRLLRIPLTPNDATEEGMAAISEERLGVSGHAARRRHALRVMAATIALESGFAEVLAWLADHTTAGDAVDIAFRSKRGILDVSAPGAHLKDISYLAGAIAVAGRCRNEPDAAGLLMAAKQPMRLLPLLRALRADGELLAAHHLPEDALGIYDEMAG